MKNCRDNCKASSVSTDGGHVGFDLSFFMCVREGSKMELFFALVSAFMVVKTQQFIHRPFTIAVLLWPKMFSLCLLTQKLELLSS